MPCCSSCSQFCLTTSNFCSGCATNLKVIPVIDIDTRAEIIPSISTSTLSSVLTAEFGTITNEVRKNKELQHLKDHPGSSCSIISSSFGIDPKSMVSLVQQQVELWTCYKGEVPYSLG